MLRAAQEGHLATLRYLVDEKGCSLDVKDDVMIVFSVMLSSVCFIVALIAIVCMFILAVILMMMMMMMADVYAIVEQDTSADGS